MRLLRTFAALFLAFGSLLLSSPALADEIVQDPPEIAAPSAEELLPTIIVTPGGDDSSYEVPITDVVVFMGETYSSVYATTNAVITFGNPDGTYWDYPQTTSISLGSQDWVVYPQWREDEHLIITYTENAFQIDIAARPIYDQNAELVSRLLLSGTIDENRNISFSYYLENTEQFPDLRFGVRTPEGNVLDLEAAGLYESEVAPEEGEILAPEPEPSPEPTPEPTPERIDVVEGYGTEGANQWVTLTAPAGKVFTEVLFASYGLPTATTAGWEVNPSCNASSSVPIIESLAIGQNSVRINVTNDFFEQDPCGGIQKRLAVSLAYGDDPNASPVEPAPEPTETAEPTPEPSPSALPEPTQAPSPEPTSTPQPPVLPEPEATPSIEPVPVEPTPIPEVTPEPQPTPSPQPEPSPSPTPTPEPTVEPVPSPQPTSEPTPSIEPTIEPTPQPSVTQTPTPVVTPTPSPEPKPIPTPEPAPTTPEEVTSDTPIADVISVIENVVPTSLTEEQVEVLVSIALQTFETASVGSPEYEQALDLLLVAAQADDIVLDEELAAIPLIGNVAGAAVEVFNAIGNAGADMSPQVREQSEKVVIAAVIVGQVAMTAVASATSAASVAARRP